MGQIFQVRAQNKKEAKELLNLRGKIIGDIKVVVKSGKNIKIRHLMGESLGLYEGYVEVY